MPLAVEGDKQEVKAIIGVRKIRGKKSYLVQQEGQLEEYTSQELAENCENAHNKILAYKKQATKKRGTK